MENMTSKVRKCILTKDKVILNLLAPTCLAEKLKQGSVYHCVALRELMMTVWKEGNPSTAKMVSTGWQHQSKPVVTAAFGDFVCHVNLQFCDFADAY